jgi:hypothetical protein
MTIRMKEIGWYKSEDGTGFATTFQATGLPEGKIYIIGFAGMNQWRVACCKKEGERLERLSMPDTIFPTPDLALKAVEEALS